MAGLDDYDLVKRLSENAEGRTVILVRRKGDKSAAQRIIRRFTPPLDKFGAVKYRQAIELFFESALTQESVAKISAHWAPVHRVSQVDNGIFLESDYYEKSVKWLIDRAVRLKHADLHQIANAIASGLTDLHNDKSRGHGNLMASRILIKGNGAIARSSIVLNNPMPDSSVTDDVTAKDLFQAGRILHQLAAGSPYEEGKTPFPIQISNKALGGKGAEWAKLCSLLLNPDPARRLKTLEEFKAHVDQLRPSQAVKSAAVVTSCVVVACSLIFAFHHKKPVVLIPTTQDQNKTDDGHQTIDPNDDHGKVKVPDTTDKDFIGNWKLLCHDYEFQHWDAAIGAFARNPGALESGGDPAIQMILGKTSQPAASGWDPKNISGEGVPYSALGVMTFAPERLRQIKPQVEAALAEIKEIKSSLASEATDPDDRHLLKHLQAGAAYPAFKPQYQQISMEIKSLAELNPAADVGDHLNLFNMLNELVQASGKSDQILTEFKTITNDAQEAEKKVPGYGLGSLAKLADNEMHDGSTTPDELERQMRHGQDVGNDLLVFLRDTWPNVDQADFKLKIPNDPPSEDLFVKWKQEAGSRLKLTEPDPRLAWDPRERLKKISGNDKLPRELCTGAGNLLNEINPLMDTEKLPWGRANHDEIIKRVKEAEPRVEEIEQKANIALAGDKDELKKWRDQLLKGNVNYNDHDDRLNDDFRKWLQLTLDKHAANLAEIEQSVDDKAKAVRDIDFKPAATTDALQGEWKDAQNRLVRKLADDEFDAFRKDDLKKFDGTVEDIKARQLELQTDFAKRLSKASGYLVKAQLVEGMLNSLHGLDDQVDTGDQSSTKIKVADWPSQEIPEQKNMPPKVSELVKLIGRLHDVTKNPVGPLAPLIANQQSGSPPPTTYERISKSYTRWNAWNQFIPSTPMADTELDNIVTLRRAVDASIEKVDDPAQKAKLTSVSKARALLLWDQCFSIATNANAQKDDQVHLVLSRQRDFGVESKNPIVLYDQALNNLKLSLPQDGALPPAEALAEPVRRFNQTAAALRDAVKEPLAHFPEPGSKSDSIEPSPLDDGLLKNINWKMTPVPNNNNGSVWLATWSGGSADDCRMCFREVIPAGKDPALKPFCLAEDDVSVELFKDVVEGAGQMESLLKASPPWINTGNSDGRMHDNGVCAWRIKDKRIELNNAYWFSTSVPALKDPNNQQDPDAAVRYYKSTPPAPKWRHPMTFVTTRGAGNFAALLNCRLPTDKEWAAALIDWKPDKAAATSNLNLRDKAAAAPDLNLRDKAFTDQEEVIRHLVDKEKMDADPMKPDKGTIFEGKGSTSWNKELSGPAGAQPLDDGWLWFQPTEADGNGFHHMVGNVWKYVLRDGSTPHVVGGSALSPETIGLFEPVKVLNPGRATGWADVGFRLAFSMPQNSVKWVIDRVKQEKYLPYTAP